MPEYLDRSRESFLEFKTRIQPSTIVDEYQALLEDLFLIRNPRFKFQKIYTDELTDFIGQYTNNRSLDDCGAWFYFPWNKTIAHYLPHDEHQEIRTARNRNIITKDEQEKLYGLRVAYAGLSVGSHGVATFALMGGARSIHLADPDVVSPSNHTVYGMI